MSNLPIPRCKAPGCGKEIPPYLGVGRPQEYCDTACRVAAWRARHARGYEAAGPVDIAGGCGEDAVEAVALGNLGPTDEQAALAVMEARNLIASMKRLSREARPELAWRFSEAAKQLTATMTELFGDADD